MPIHDWTKVPAGLFHDFHQSWSIRIKDALNAGCLPEGVVALVEQRVAGRVGDVLAIESTGRLSRETATNGGVATLERPVTRVVQRNARPNYANRANRIVIKHHLGRIIAVIEIVSPGNKSSRPALRSFVDKTTDFFNAGIHVLIVDLFPPTPRDPLGIHKAIWDEIDEQDFSFPPGKDRILASYEIADDLTAFVEPLGVGDALPDMPLFLASGVHVKVPLEPTYLATWEASPADLRTAVETGVLPEPDADEP